MSVGLGGGGLGRRGDGGDRGVGRRGGGLGAGGVGGGLRGPRRLLLVALLVAAHHGLEEEVQRVGVVALDAERDALHRPAVVRAALDLPLGDDGRALPARGGVRPGRDLPDLPPAQDHLVDHGDRADEGAEARVQAGLLGVEEDVERRLLVLEEVGPAVLLALAAREADGVLDAGVLGAAHVSAGDEEAGDGGTDEGADLER